MISIRLRPSVEVLTLSAIHATKVQNLVSAKQYRTLWAYPGLYRDGFTFQKPSAQACYKPNNLGLCVSHRIPSASEVLGPQKGVKLELTQVNNNNNNNNVFIRCYPSQLI